MDADKQTTATFNSGLPLFGLPVSAGANDADETQRHGVSD